MKILNLNNINKKYNKKYVLDGLDMDITENEIFGLIGRNGAGKSTLLNIISGIIHKTSGSMSVANNKNIENIKKEIGVMPDSSNLYQNITAIKFLKYMASVKNIKHSTDYYYKILDEVGLDNFENKKLKNFSFGMKKKISIAQAILGNPSLVILDEPTSGLDPESSIKIRKLILKLKNQGKTIFLTSHNFEEIEEICDRLAIMNHGNIAKIGSIEDLKQDTNEIEVKINILEKLDYKKYNYIENVLKHNDRILKKQEDRCLYIHLKTVKQIPKTIEILIENNIKILEVTQRKHSLQEVFMSI